MRHIRLYESQGNNYWLAEGIDLNYKGYEEISKAAADRVMRTLEEVGLEIDKNGWDYYHEELVGCRLCDSECYLSCPACDGECESKDGEDCIRCEGEGSIKCPRANLVAFKAYPKIGRELFVTVDHSSDSYWQVEMLSVEDAHGHLTVTQSLVFRCDEIRGLEMAIKGPVKDNLAKYEKLEELAKSTLDLKLGVSLAG